MRFGFSYIGLLWLIMLLLPNFIWTKTNHETNDAYQMPVLFSLDNTPEKIGIHMPEMLAVKCLSNLISR